MKKTLLATALLFGLGASGLAAAQDASPWILRFGYGAVVPESDNGTLANGTLKTSVGANSKPTISIEYLFNRNLGIEVLGALPFRHTISLNGTRAATTRQLPPTITLNWHFMPGQTISPFLGVGVNYTDFFSERTFGPLAGTRLHIDSSFGLAAHAGVDFRINDNWLATADVYWVNIEPDVKVNGAKVGTVKINPLVYGLSVGYRF